jgi:hypothetical protein
VLMQNAMVLNSDQKVTFVLGLWIVAIMQEDTSFRESCTRDFHGAKIMCTSFRESCTRDFHGAKIMRTELQAFQREHGTLFTVLEVSLVQAFRILFYSYWLLPGLVLHLVLA